MATHEVVTRGRDAPCWLYYGASCCCPLQVMSLCQTQRRIGILRGELGLGGGGSPEDVAADKGNPRYQLPLGVLGRVSHQGQLRNCKLHKSQDISYLRQYGEGRKPVRPSVLVTSPSLMATVSFPFQNVGIVKYIFIIN
jgi:hypothetical protein